MCRHCGETYRGLACPCRKRAWAAVRAASPPGLRSCSAETGAGEGDGSGGSVGSDGSDESDESTAETVRG